MIDNKLKIPSPLSYSQILSDIGVFIKRIKENQMKVMTGDKMINDNIRPVTKQVHPNSVFSMKMEKFFGRSPIDLEFYEFSGYRSTGSQGENITMHTNMDTLFGNAPNNIKDYEFDIAIVYYDVFDDDEYSFYITYTRFTLNVTNNIEFEEPVSQNGNLFPSSKSNPKSKFPIVLNFIWNIFKILLALSTIVFLAWLLYKIYNEGYLLSAWNLIIDLTTCIAPVCKILKDLITSNNNENRE